MVYPSAPDVESQESTVPKALEENTTMIVDDDNDGKGMGIAIFILLLMGTALAFFLPYFITIFNITALVLASVLRCGCCCAKNYNLKPHVKKMATATLVTLVLLFIVSIIVTVMSIMAIQSGMILYHTYPGTFSDVNSVNVTKLWPVSIIGYVLIGLALIFSGIFTWGRKCGAPRH